MNKWLEYIITVWKVKVYNEWNSECFDCKYLVGESFLLIMVVSTCLMFIVVYTEFNAFILEIELE